MLNEKKYLLMTYKGSQSFSSTFDILYKYCRF